MCHEEYSDQCYSPNESPTIYVLIATMIVTGLALNPKGKALMDGSSWG
jgi:hypothetical protein